MSNNVSDKIFNFVYIAAMKDAVSMGAYKGEKKWLYTKTEENIKEEKKKLVKDSVKKHVTEILGGKYYKLKQSDYDADFLSLANYIVEHINYIDQGEFTFGNAQKLINMTVKYCYIKYFNGNLQEARDIFEYCHCPLDQQMLKKVWDKQSSYLKQDTKGYTKTAFLMSWGAEKVTTEERLPQRYLDYQDAVRRIIDEYKEEPKPRNPIEYDYCMWNE